MEQYNVTGMSLGACSAKGGESGLQGAGGHGLLRESSDKFHGRGGDGLSPRDHSRRGKRRLRRFGKGKTRRQRHKRQKQRTHWPTMIHQCFESVSSVRWCFW